MKACATLLLLILLGVGGIGITFWGVSQQGSDGTGVVATAIPPQVAAAATITTHYQRFEHGFMLELVNGQSMFETSRPCVYAYAYDTDKGIVMPGIQTGFDYCIPVSGLPESLLLDAPDGLMSPTGIFAQVWAAYPMVQAGLGYATETDYFYEGVVPSPDNSMGGEQWFRPIITLPDGTGLYCGSVGHAAGQCFVK